MNRVIDFVIIFYKFVGFFFCLEEFIFLTKKLFGIRFLMLTRMNIQDGVIWLGKNAIVVFQVDVLSSQ